MQNYYCWGGEFDLEAWLESEGFEVYSVSVGPISSNWDRAIETFYQIKGGQIDYGISHSAENGLIRKPENKNYRGFYPEWDADHPVHIIGHSMGGLTARMLEIQLTSEFKDEESQLLSNPNTGWIKSLTTLSTPHNGTSLAPIVVDTFPFVQKMATVIGSLQENSLLEKLYDFDLEQWDLDRRKGEKIVDYFKRLKNSPMRESNNFCSHDLSIAGAVEFNSIYKTDTDVHYFTYSTYATRKQKRSERHIPDDEMSWNLWSAGFAMGRSSKTDSTWYENDGVVNTISMLAPFSGNHGPEPKKIYDGTSVKGVWQNMGRLHLDHHKVVGHAHTSDEETILKNIYGTHCRILYDL